MRVYLDACCLNRPFDDQSQPRVFAESQAVITILEAAKQGRHEWVTSDVLELEIARNPHADKRGLVESLLADAHRRVQAGPWSRARAAALVAAGLEPFDALHVAIAEEHACNVVLTTDEKLIRRARRLPACAVRVENPLRWLSEVFDDE